MKEVKINLEKEGTAFYYSYTTEVGKHLYSRIGKFLTIQAAVDGFKKMVETGRM